MPRFSANLGFLFTEHKLPAAIRAAHNAGFDAVECHWPYDVPPADVRAALAETGLAMLGINTIKGDTGQFGRAGLPGAEALARSDIDQAIEYAAAIQARAVHVLAGVATGGAAERTFVDNLRYGAERAAAHDITVLVEALNRHDNPGYLIDSTDRAASVLAAVDRPNVRLMFDCYHVARTIGPERVVDRFHQLRPHIGHVQFAGVPDRGAPDVGTLDHAALFAALDRAGWKHPLGAEYRPAGPTLDSLSWMQTLCS